MSNLHFGKSKFARFISSKGFYIALALCVVGAGTAAYLTAQNTLGSLTEQNPENFTGGGSYTAEVSDIPWDDPVKDVEKTQSQVPKDSSASQQQSSTASSSGTPAVKSESASETLASQNEQPKLLFVVPLSGEIVNPYSEGELVKSTTLGDWRTHDGIDIKAENLSAVKACADGEVARVYEDALWGTVVEVTHAGNLTSVYASLSKEVSVKAGQEVEAGEIIGTVGGTAHAEIKLDPHLHFAMKKNGKWVDPFDVMGVNF